MLEAAAVDRGARALHLAEEDANGWLLVLELVYPLASPRVELTWVSTDQVMTVCHLAQAGVLDVRQIQHTCLTLPSLRASTTWWHMVYLKSMQPADGGSLNPSCHNTAVVHNIARQPAL